ncbi:MAG TPA: prolipoprotein diacylglyceryl transferase [Alphaproteobacteria bacterium]|nr:prolipoprotein diacylglyceryl transferase [Alphaproteobacteria bacterium]
MALHFPDLDPVALRIGPLAIRWYALSYITGILLGWWHVRRIATAPPKAMTAAQVDDLVLWCTLGIVLGGRIGYVLFYQPSYYFAHPGEILALWHGGMSFHGGLLGVVLALLLFCWRNSLSFFMVGDAVCCAVPIGLFFGRLANFVNGELFGRPTDLPWGMIFPRGGPEPRHPSQIYEALLEGAVLFLVLFFLRRTGLRERPGFLAGAFLVGYGIARIIGECFRAPDPFMGYFAFGLTEGQLLSAPLILCGAWLMWQAKRPSAKRE